MEDNVLLPVVLSELIDYNDEKGRGDPEIGSNVEKNLAFIIP